MLYRWRKEYNEYGQNNVPDGTYIDVSTGYDHICGLKTDKTVTCWGDNSYGHFSVPLGTFEKIDSGARHNCGLRENGTIECWG